MERADANGGASVEAPPHHPSGPSGARAAAQFQRTVRLDRRPFTAVPAPLEMS